VPSVVARPTAHTTTPEVLDETWGPTTMMRITGFDVHGWFLRAQLTYDATAPDLPRQVRDLEDVVFSSIVSRPAGPVPDLRPIAVSADRLPPGWDA